MKPADIAHARLVSQQIAGSAFTHAKELVAYMGALQAQDYAMAKWAIGIRLPASTDKQIEAALDKASIIRAHVLRPTWHIIPAEDIYWMLALSCEKIKSLMKVMDRYLELTEKILHKSNNIIAKCLRDGKHMTREDIALYLEKAKIATGGPNRLPHLLLRAEMDGIACSGKMNGDKRTYTLLEEYIPKKKILSKEESLALLAKKYFSSHGPATIEDFTWWCGQSVKDAKRGLEMVKQDFISAKINDRVYWFKNNLEAAGINKPSVHLLPAFDEFIISYKDRSASLAAAHQKNIITKNGIFYAAILVNGQVTGSWKRTTQKDKIIIETSLFHAHNKSNMGLLQKSVAAFGKFSDKKTMLVHNK